MLARTRGVRGSDAGELKMADARREWGATMAKVMDHAPAESEAPAESLRQKSERIAREFAPITVAEFEC